MTTIGTGEAPTSASSSFYSVAQAAEQDLRRAGEDAMLDGGPSALEIAELQHDFERLQQGLSAHVGVRRRYFESADRLVENLKS
ncbi:MAG: hypothetical protein AAFU79_28775 [Myxococcota bacterium]